MRLVNHVSFLETEELKSTNDETLRTCLCVVTGAFNGSSGNETGTMP